MSEKDEYMARVSARLEARHKMYEGFGQKHTNAQWAKILGLSRNVTWRYFKRGLTVEDICRIRHINL